MDAPQRLPEAQQPHVEIVELPRTGEITPPLRDHESAIRRETTAFDLYQRSARETRNLVLTAAVLAVLLLATKAGATSIEKFSWFGFELAINDRTKISGVLGLATLLFSLWSVASAYGTAALWRKCGLFYREILQPSDNPWVLALDRIAKIVGALLIFSLLFYSIFSAGTDIFYLIVARPSEWIVEVIRY